MPRTFSDSVEEDLAEVFFDVNEFAERVSIRRGVLPPTTRVAAIVKSRSYEAVNESGFITSVEATDFDFIRSSYRLMGESTSSPRSGDRITRANGDEYEVLPIGNEPCSKAIGTTGHLRVHTKRVQ